MKKYGKDYFLHMAFSHMVYLDYDDIDTDRFVINTYVSTLGKQVEIKEHEKLNEAFNYKQDMINDDVEGLFDDEVGVYVDYKFNGGYISILYITLDASSNLIVKFPKYKSLSYPDNTPPDIHITPDKFKKLINMEKLIEKI